MNNILVAQSGGPTSAINGTLSGVIRAGIESERVDKVYGACYGIQGVLEEKFVDLTQIMQGEEEWSTEDKLDLLRRTPAAALGSCRFKLNDIQEDDSQYERIIEIFRKKEICYFVYIGGNDSMDTVYKLSEYCKAKGIKDITVVGAPKTIDNDLCGIDHCPGFGSAAKYIATVFAELEREAEVYESPNVIIVELMGRHAGWLTAAAALAEKKEGRIPYLIYLEEHPFDMKHFLHDVQMALQNHSAVMVAVSEGVHDESGRFICETDAPKQQDVFGHSMLAGTGRILEEKVRNVIGCKVRSIELNLLQRCAAHMMSKTDIEESERLGYQAAEMALRGAGGQMSSLSRTTDDPYRVVYESVPISQVANLEKKVPLEWITAGGNGVTEDMITYLKPLIQGEISSVYKDGVPQYMYLK